MMAKEDFIYIVSNTQKYIERLSKLEDALGGILLEDFAEYPSQILDYVQKQFNTEFTDDVWDDIYSGRDPESIYDKIIKLWIEN